MIGHDHHRRGAAAGRYAAYFKADREYPQQAGRPAPYAVNTLRFVEKRENQPRSRNALRKMERNPRQAENTEGKVSGFDDRLSENVTRNADPCVPSAASSAGRRC